MKLFKRRKAEKNSKFKLTDFVEFYYKDEICYGTITDIYYKEENKIFYDIDLAGQCPTTIENIEESKVIKIHKN